MKRIIIIALLASSLIYAQNFPRPAYLINNQPFPYAIDISQSFSSAKEKYKVDDENLKFYKKDFLIDGYLLPIKQSKDLLIILGAGYSRTSLGFDNRNDLNRDYYGEYLNFFATGAFNEKWNWFNYQSVGYFSDKNSGFDKHAAKYFQISKIGYKYTPNMSFSAGLLYNSNLGDNIILPILGFAYAGNSFVFETNLPIDLKFRYLWTKNFQTVFSVNMLANGFYDYETSEKINYSAVETNIKVEYKIFNWIWLNSSLKMTTSEEWHLRFSDQKVKRDEGRINFIVGLEVRPE